MYLNMVSVGIALVFTGVLLIASRFGNEKKELGWGKSVLVGIFQGIAIAPGVSRSGATISSSLFSGLKREEAVNYSFLLAIPAILGASLFKAKELVSADVSTASLAAGFVASLVIGYLTLRFLKKIVMQKKFSWFAPYCFVLGIVLIVLN
jgi:undecaprenyl-diphosphatase